MTIIRKEVFRSGRVVESYSTPSSFDQRVSELFDAKMSELEQEEAEELGEGDDDAVPA